MRFKPHSYQQLAITKILDNQAAGLFLDMGLGKTVCALTAARELTLERFQVSKVLVIAPKRVAQVTWPAELKKWEHLQDMRYSVVLGTAKERRAALMKPAQVYIINRENVSWLVEHYGPRWPFDMVILDELSSFKNRSAKRWKDLKKVLPFIRRIVGLTGTPAPNGLMDLWAQVYLLDRGARLGRTLTAFRDRYFRPGKRNGHVVYEWIPREGSQDRIYASLADLCVSMDAKDWLEMPERLEVDIEVDLAPEDLEKYRKMEADLLLPFDGGDVVADTAGVLVGKLLQMASGAVYNENGDVQELHTAKLEALEDLVESSNGKPLLVFYWFRHELERLKAKFPGAKTLDTPKDVKDWNTGKTPLLLAHPASAGHGLNLQEGGNTIVWFSLTWSLELYQQANARLYRQGQKNTVVVYHLISKKTIDEQVLKALNAKNMTQFALLDALKSRKGLHGLE